VNPAILRRGDLELAEEGEDVLTMVTVKLNHLSVVRILHHCPVTIVLLKAGGFMNEEENKVRREGLAFLR